MKVELLLDIMESRPERLSLIARALEQWFVIVSCRLNGHERYADSLTELTCGSNNFEIDFGKKDCIQAIHELRNLLDPYEIMIAVKCNREQVLPR